MKKIYACIILLTAMAGLSSCHLSIGYPERQGIISRASLTPHKIVLVGKVEFDPPMPDTKQELNCPWPSYFRNLMWMVCKNELRGLDYPDKLFPTSPDFGGRIVAPLGETFYVLTDADRPFYILAGVIYMSIYNYGSGGRYYSSIYPGSFFINIKPGDEAVYIGTIRYHRDNFCGLKKVEIIDEYDREMPQFRVRFGAMKLSKAVIRQPREDAVFKMGVPY